MDFRKGQWVFVATSKGKKLGIYTQNRVPDPERPDLPVAQWPLAPFVHLVNEKGETVLEMPADGLNLSPVRNVSDLPKARAAHLHPDLDLATMTIRTA